MLKLPADSTRQPCVSSDVYFSTGPRLSHSTHAPRKCSRVSETSKRTLRSYRTNSRTVRDDVMSMSLRGSKRIWTSRCRLSLFNAEPVLILKDFDAWESLEFCFIEYSFSVIKSPREPHFPNRSQRYVLDSTRLPF